MHALISGQALIPAPVAATFSPEPIVRHAYRRLDVKKVLIPTKLDSVAVDILTENGAYSITQDNSAPLLQLLERHSDTYALIVRSEKVTAEIIDKLPALRIIVRAGAGYNSIDTKYARQRGIDVMNTPGANSNAVAEEVIGLMLADARHIIHADASTRAGKWEKKKFMGREIAGKTVGIVGLGNIGQSVAQRLTGFDCRLLGYDPVIASERAAAVNVHLTDMETLFSESDYITLHIPENDDTREIVNSDLLALVKDGATIINCARAGIIDEEAIRVAKARKNLRFLNDVYPKDQTGVKTVSDVADIMMPHLGASTVEANYDAARRAAEQLIDLDQKGITSFIVNRDIPEGLDVAYCNLAFTLAKLCRCLVGRNTSLKLVETSIYGSLTPFADWLLVPIVGGIWESFDRTMDFQAARKYLKEMGIEYVDRAVDLTKGYEASITIDLTSTVDAHNLRRVSVRGTVAERVVMVSRINEFDRLYFEPGGNSILFLYDDRPGVIGTIGIELAAAGINIHDVRNPHDAESNRSLAIMKVNRPVDADLLDKIGRKVQAIASHSVTL